jgi:metal-sulfur cluster biosynthetic enzyme
VAELTRGRGRSSLPVVKAPRPEHALPAHVTSHASGGRDRWSPPLEDPPGDPRSATWNLLREVLDPELPISLVDLGLIYGVEIEEGCARVDLTFTATACPCMEFIREDIEDRLLRESWIDRVEIREVWDPPWTRDRISERGRAQLRKLGVGV